MDFDVDRFEVFFVDVFFLFHIFIFFLAKLNFKQREKKTKKNKFCKKKKMNSDLYNTVSTAEHFVDLFQRGINDQNMVDISKGLLSNPSVSEIFLGINEVGDEGAKEISQVIKASTTLEAIHLCKNKIGDAGAGYILESLQNNTTLTYLDLNGNNIKEETLEEINKLIKRNKN